MSTHYDSVAESEGRWWIVSVPSLEITGQDSTLFVLTTSIEFASPGKTETPTTLSSSIATEDIVMEHFPLPTPSGDILKKEFLDPMRASGSAQPRQGEQIHIP